MNRKDQTYKPRDERGVRIQTYRRFKEGEDYLPVEGNEVAEMYRIARENMENLKRIGRPPVFASVEELQQGIVNYWRYLEDANRREIKLIPDVEGLCSFLGISRDMLFEWERNNFHGFASTIKTAKNDIASIKKQLGEQGKIPPIVMAMDFNNNHGYVQKQEISVQPVNPLGETPDVVQIAERYKQLPE